MTDQAPWISYQTSHPIRVVGTFKNELGERFVIYTNKDGDKPFITGDEYAWEPKVSLLWNKFTFSEYEREQIAKILWPTLVDTIKMAEALERLSEPGETPESAVRRYELEEQQTRQREYGIVLGDLTATPDNS